MHQEYEHSIEIIRHGGRTGWHVGVKSGDELPVPVNNIRDPRYGRMIERWPDGRFTFENRKNHTIYQHKFTPRRNKK